MAIIGDFLRAYAEKHGALPYSEKGAEYALYEMKGSVRSPAFFDAMYTTLENGVAYWDDERRCLVNGDFDYLNKPLPQTVFHMFASGDEPMSSAIVLMADKWGAYSPTVRWVLTNSGVGQFQLVKGTPHADDPLGRTLSELEPRYGILR
jgi:hypothetical protein